MLTFVNIVTPQLSIISIFGNVMTTKTISMALTMVFTISLMTMGFSNAYAIQVDTSERDVYMEGLVDQYGSYAEISYELEKRLKSLEQELVDTSLNNEDALKIQNDINELKTELDTASDNAILIQKTIDKELEMDTKLKIELEESRSILLDSQDTIPWSGLGTSNTHQAVVISIISDDPESFRPAIEKLIGADVPLIIKQGAEDPFTTCSSREVDCVNLQGGLRIANNPDGDQCTLGFPVTHDVSGDNIQGYLTAGHCFAYNDNIHQAKWYEGKIGEVSIRLFGTSGDTEFIEATGAETWDAGKVYSAANSEYSGINTKVNPSSTELIAFSGASSDIIDWGYVDSTSWTCSKGGVTVSGMYKTQYTATEGGDSGAPVFNPTWNVKEFYGTVSCTESTTDNDMVFENWDTISYWLDVS
jgi:hypothetical protein